MPTLEEHPRQGHSFGSAFFYVVGALTKDKYCWYQCTVKGGREGSDIDAVQLATTCELLGQALTVVTSTWGKLINTAIGCGNVNACVTDARRKDMKAEWEGFEFIGQVYRRLSRKPVS